MLVFRPRGPVTSNPPPDNRTPQQLAGTVLVAAAEFPAALLPLLAGRVLHPTAPAAVTSADRPPVALTLRSEPAPFFAGSAGARTGPAQPLTAQQRPGLVRAFVSEPVPPSPGLLLEVLVPAAGVAPQIPARTLVAFPEPLRPEAGYALIYRAVWESDSPPVPPPPPTEPTAPGGVFRRSDSSVVFRSGDTVRAFRRSDSSVVFRRVP